LYQAFPELELFLLIILLTACKITKRFSSLPKKSIGKTFCIACLMKANSKRYNLAEPIDKQLPATCH
jgi:hypothetical protein